MYNYIQDYLQKGNYPFHMPGHKRNPMFFPQGLFALDITEIAGMDVLHNPKGIIRDFQEVIADFYGAHESFLLVNGSSAGVVAAINAVTDKDTPVYAARNGHSSMYHALALAGAAPVYLLPETTPDGLSGGIVPESLDNIAKGAVVFVVSPTYEGFVSDIKEIAARVHSQGGVLIVDEAHGAHFKFHDAFPVSALDMGADIVVQSFHKTLPALGQMAVLHVKGAGIDTARLRFFLRTVQTTSPSYMMMGQLDYMLKMLWKRPEIFETYVKRLKELRRALSPSSVQAISLVGRETVGSHGIFDIDASKLLFRINMYQDASEISLMLSEIYHVELEMARCFHMLAMTSVADTDDGFQRLWGSIGALNIRLESQLDVVATAAKASKLAYAHDVVMTPADVLRHKSEQIPWENAPGRIAAEVVAAYPPGVAVVAPGERIPDGLPKLMEFVRVVV